MRRGVLFIALVAAGIAQVGGATGASQVPATNREAQLRLAAAAFATASAKGDAAAMALFYAPDMIAVSPQSPRPLVGREASRAAFESLFKQPGATHTVTTERVAVSGDGTMAYTTGTWSAGFDQGDRRLTGTGHLLTVWQLIAGEWKIAAVSAFPYPPPARGGGAVTK